MRVLNDVVLNQVLVRFTSRAGTNITPEVLARVQASGVCWAGGTNWAGEPAMRISAVRMADDAGGCGEIGGDDRGGFNDVR